MSPQGRPLDRSIPKPQNCVVMSDIRVFINRKPSLRLESIRMFKVDELILSILSRQ
jgi:hypothetical protein